MTNNGNLTTFYIVRHGQTDWNVNKRVQGQTDILLNETGELESKDIAKQLKEVKFDLAFSSDLLRAKRTTEIIALEHALTVETTKLLRERQFGKYEGEPSQTVWKLYNTLIEKLNHQEKFRHKIEHDVESDEELSGRVITFLRETAIANPGKTILVGSHGGVIFTLLIHLGYVTYEELQRPKFENTGYVKLSSDGTNFFVDEIKGLTKKRQLDL